MFSSLPLLHNRILPLPEWHIKYTYENGNSIPCFLVICTGAQSDQVVATADSVMGHVLSFLLEPEPRVAAERSACSLSLTGSECKQDHATPTPGFSALHSDIQSSKDT